MAPEVAKERLGEPESWETIGKTGWLRVETDKGFTYFFHKKKKLTAWKCPPEIAEEVAELDGVLGVSAPAAATAPEDAGGAAAGVGGANSDSVGGVATNEGIAAEASAAAGKTKPPKVERERLRKEHVEQEQKMSEEKKRMLNFKQLLLEKGVRPFDKYEKWLPKLLHDPRWIAITNQVERKALFAAYAKRIDSDRQKQEADKKRGGREGFKELLKAAQDAGLFDGKTGDQAVRAVEKRHGEEKRWLCVPARERERLIVELAQQLAEQRKRAQDEARINFQKLCREVLRGKERDPPPFRKIEPALRKDPRWAPLACTADRERLYGQVIREVETARREKEKRQRFDKEELERTRKKRKMSAEEEVLVNFLAERVKAPYATTWNDVRAALADAPQLRDCRLDLGEQERLFAEFQHAATEARCQEFLLYLSALPVDVAGPGLTFEQVLSGSLDAAAARAFDGMPEEALRAAWAEWQGQAHERAVEECRMWLRSCGLLAGAEGVDEGSAAFDALVSKLAAADVRFRRLGVKPEEQRELVARRLQEMRDLRAQARGGAGGGDDD